MAGEERDRALLLDMLSYAEEAVALVRGVGFEQHQKDRIRVLALERVVEIIGEAAAQVSQATKDEIVKIPWKLIRGQRNVLAHMYGKVDQFQLYRTAKEDLPGLIAVLKKRIGDV